MSDLLTCHLCQTTITSGENAALALKDIIKSMQATHPMIVTDQGISSLPWFQTIQKQLDQVLVFDGVSANPKDKEVMDGAACYLKNKCDLIIGMGGGSSMDCAKAVSAMVRHGGFIMEYGRSRVDRTYFSQGREKLILIPTTIGTGSELSPHAVITNTALAKKSDLQETIFYPDHVILDPLLLMTLPPKIVKDTGVDALCHAIEVYTSKKAVQQFAPLHEVAALRAIQLVAKYLRRAVFSWDVDLEAKAMIQWAATLAGFALDLDAGCVHGLAGVLQQHYHEMSHGESVGLLLPSVMEYNRACCLERFQEIARAFDIPVDTLSLDEASKQAVSSVRALLKDIGFVKLSDFMKDAQDIEAFYEVGAANSCNKNNIRSVTPKEVRAIYYEAYQEAYQ